MGFGIQGRVEVDAIELTKAPSPTAAKPSKFATLEVTPHSMSTIACRLALSGATAARPSRAYRVVLGCSSRVDGAQL
jgi:hypothetical protein